MSISTAAHVLGLFLSPLTLLVSLLNAGIVLVAVAWRRRLRNCTNALLVLMVLPDLILVTMQCSATLMFILEIHVEIHLPLCYALHVIQPGAFGASMYHQVSLALQRYLHILHNNKILRSFPGVVVCLICSWILPLVPLIYSLIEGFQSRVTNAIEISRTNLTQFKNAVNTSRFLMEVHYEEYTLPESFLVDDPILTTSPNINDEVKESFMTCLFLDRFHTNQIIFNMILHLILPAIIIGFCYISIFKRSHSLSSRLQVSRRSTMNRRRRDRQLLRLCLVLLILFFVGYGPFAVARGLNSHNDLLLIICTFIYCLAFSNNAIIYGLLNTQFRMTFNEMLYQVCNCWQILRTRTEEDSASGIERNSFRMSSSTLNSVNVVGNNGNLRTGILRRYDNRHSNTNEAESVL